MHAGGLRMMLRLAAVIGLALFIAPDLSTPGAAPAGEDGEFQSLFNGVDLSGWEGDASRWSVRDGAITGSTFEAPLKNNTFLSWRGGIVKDFELRLKFRIQAKEADSFANSGIQYRSRTFDFKDHVVAGYQADIDNTGQFLGILYEERGRGLLAKAGEQVKVNNGPSNIPQPAVLGATASAAELDAIKSAVKRGEWLDYTVIAEKHRLRHFINGVQTVDVVDDDMMRAAGEGLLAFQLHVGPPMQVQFKDIRLKDFKASGPNWRELQKNRAATPSTPAESIQLASGFKAELIYTVPRSEQGSWVALTVDAKGRLLTADQYGAVYRITPPAVGASAPASVEKLATPLSGAQGLLYAFDSLYVMVNETPTLEPGIWRLRDTDGDDRFDETKLILSMYGRGEHGTHGLAVGKDGRSIYFAAGNFTAMPTALMKTKTMAHFGPERPRRYGLRAGWVRRPHRPERRTAAVVCRGFSQSLRHRFRRQRRAVHLRFRHGAGSGPAVVHAHSHRAYRRRRRLRLAQRRRTLARLL